MPRRVKFKPCDECGIRVHSRRKYCVRCGGYARWSQQANTRYYARRQQGLCVQCGKSPTGTLLCDDCKVLRATEGKQLPAAFSMYFPLDVRCHLDDLFRGLRLVGADQATQRGWELKPWSGTMPDPLNAVDALKELLMNGYVPVDALLVKRTKEDYERIWIFAKPDEASRRILVEKAEVLEIFGRPN
jgi:hypothetical protein